MSRDSLHEFRESGGIHWGRDGETEMTFRVKTCGGEGIFGDVNANEETIHTNTSLELDKAGVASRPILHDDKGSLTQSTYHGYGRQGTHSVEGSWTQEQLSSPAFPLLMDRDKTHSYKLYTINS